MRGWKRDAVASEKASESPLKAHKRASRTVAAVRTSLQKSFWNACAPLRAPLSLSFLLFSRRSFSWKFRARTCEHVRYRKSDDYSAERIGFYFYWLLEAISLPSFLLVLHIRNIQNTFNNSKRRNNILAFIEIKSVFCKLNFSIHFRRNTYYKSVSENLISMTMCSYQNFYIVK